MAYSSDISRTLINQLTKFATLNRHQLVGHLANLDFWAAEVRHCLEVIDGYSRRFERMKAAQMKFVADHGTIEFDIDDPCCTRTTATPPRRVPSQELGDAGRQLRDAFYRFLIRCHHENLLGEVALRGVCRSLEIGVESSDVGQPS
ncbi:hypothetical protein TA3x_001740 [Tundrisphaera sp. TA3]|uniref:hypothetical protein n=1 Tax=Tundrisphaera sp. TA3 TaxID=3435775 RepID=UPI003EBB0A38